MTGACEPERTPEQGVGCAIGRLSLPGSSEEAREAARRTLLSSPSRWTLRRLEEATLAAESSRHSSELAPLLRSVMVGVADQVEAEELRAASAAVRARHEALTTFLALDSTREQRRRAEWVFADLLLDPFLELVVQGLQEALEGPWSRVGTEEAVEARRTIGRWYERLAPAVGREVVFDMPSGLPVRSTGSDGRTGRVAVTWPGLQELHWEWPISGFGVRKDLIEVLDEGRWTPVFGWLRQAGVRVICRRCGGFIDRTVEAECPARRFPRRAERLGS